MQWCVTLEVSFQELFLEDYLFYQGLYRENRILFACNVEHTLIFVISQLKIDAAISEVVLNHLVVILSYCVVDWQVTVEILSV